jgi:hypothetical protein
MRLPFFPGPMLWHWLSGKVIRTEKNKRNQKIPASRATFKKVDIKL